MCFAVPPRFAVPSRDAAFAGADKAETGLAYRYPAFDNGRNPGASLLKRSRSKSGVPVQAAAGCAYSRVSPAALHHPAVLFRVRCGAIGSAIPLLLRSHSLYVVRFIMQYKIIDNILSSKTEHFLCRRGTILEKKTAKTRR